jgi:hypothetical protein
MGISNSFVLPSTGSFTLTPASTGAAGGGTISLNWTAPTGRPGNDWVGLFKVGAPNDAPYWSTSTDGATTGSFTVAAPVVAGEYEFRYFLRGGSGEVARSVTVTVQ